MIFDGTAIPLMDLKLALEYRDVALRPEHLFASRLSRGEVLELIEAIEVFSEPVTVWMRERPLSSDPNDDMILQLAISGHADALVTHNIKHFGSAARRFGLVVSSPFQFIQHMDRSEHGDRSR